MRVWPEKGNVYRHERITVNKERYLLLLKSRNYIQIDLYLIILLEYQNCVSSQGFKLLDLPPIWRFDLFLFIWIIIRIKRIIRMIINTYSNNNKAILNVTERYIKCT